MRPATFSAFAALAVGAGAAGSQALADESATGAGERKGSRLRAIAPTPHTWLRSHAEDADQRASVELTEPVEPTTSANDDGALLTTDDLTETDGGDSGALTVPVATAFAPSLTASQDTCMGSRTFGVQAIGFGFSIATTWPDRQCRRWRNARALEDLGFRSAALALLCQDDEVERAMRRAGTPCPGLQLLSFPPPPAPAPEPEVEPPLMRFQDVLFDFDRSNLRPEADAILAPVLEMLQRDPTLSVDIEGHADWMGSDAYNIGLSQRRAQAVVEWLVARGIARERLNAVGKGEREPIASNETAEGRQLNRRVEVHRR
jgi:outer membrane protein OmpA-like peptidoglycan-associated protein